MKKTSLLLLLSRRKQTLEWGAEVSMGALNAARLRTPSNAARALFVHAYDGPSSRRGPPFQPNSAHGPADRRAAQPTNTQMRRAACAHAGASSRIPVLYSDVRRRLHACGV